MIVRGVAISIGGEGSGHLMILKRVSISIDNTFIRNYCSEGRIVALKSMRRRVLVLTDAIRREVLQVRYTNNNY